MNQSIRGNLLQVFTKSPTKNIEISRGLRAAVTTILPVLIMVIIDQPSLIWMALGGLYISIADVGGAYQIRAMTTATVALGGAISLGFGVLIGGTWFSVFFMFVWAFGCGMLNIYGNGGFVVGLLIACTYLIGIDVSPHNTLAALEISLFYLAGSLWGMLLALGLWRLYPYQPVRESISSCYFAIAQLLSLTQESSWMPPEESLVYKQKFQIRQKLVEARETLWAIRLTRQGISPIEEHLVILIQMLEEMFTTTTTLMELLANAKKNDFPSLWVQIYDDIGDIVMVLSKLSIAINGKTMITECVSLQDQILALRQQMNAKKAIHRDWQNSYQELLDIYYILNILEKYPKYISIVIQSINSEIYYSALKSKPSKPKATHYVNILPIQTHWLVNLRDNLTPKSMVFRHSLRFAIASVIAVLTYKIFNLPSGYWITLTVAVVLKPYASETFQRGFQRIIGTIAGGMIGILLAVWVTNPMVLVLLMIPFTIAMMAILNVNYGLFVFFLTPFVVLMENINQPGKWLVAIWRIQNTLIGGGIALLASYVIFPRWEYQQPLPQLGKMLRTNCTLFENVMAVYLGERVASESFGELSQRVRLTMINTHMSFQRYLNELFSSSKRVEPLLTLIMINQRLINSLLILHSHSQDFSEPIILLKLATFTQEISSIIINLAEAITKKQAPNPIPDWETLEASIYEHLEQLHTRRVAELNQGLDDTPTRQMVISQVIVFEQISAILLEVKGMQDAIARFSQMV